MRTLQLLSLLFYLLGVFWILILHPLVSLSTGELKPRSLFVDEHALPVHSSVIERTVKHFPDSFDESAHFCDHISTIANSCLISSTSLTIVLNPTQVSSPREQIFIGLVVKESLVSKSVQSLVYDVVKNFRFAKWTAKQVLLHISPSYQSLYAYLNTSTYEQSISNSVLTREAYILDITSLSDSLEWKEIDFITHDHLGTQPNMDMISYLWHLHPYHGIQYPECKLSQIVYEISDSLLTLLKPMDKLIRSGNPTSTANLQRRVDGYLNHICSRTFGLRTISVGHSDANLALQKSLNHFLAKNIDAIAFDFHASKTSKLKRRDSNRNLISTGSLPMLQFIFDLIYGSTYLEEELHHSYHYYILMGEQTFVGMNEFGLSGLTLVLSLFCLVMSFLHPVKSKDTSKRVPSEHPVSSIGHGISSHALSTALALLIIRNYSLLLTGEALSICQLKDQFQQSYYLQVITQEVLCFSLSMFLLSYLAHFEPASPISAEDYGNILRLFVGCEIAWSVLIPLVHQGIRDIATFYCIMLVIYLPIYFAVSLVEILSRDMRKLHLLLLSSLFVFIIGWSFAESYVYRVVQRNGFDANDDIFVREFIKQVSCLFNEPMQSVLNVSLILYCIGESRILGISRSKEAKDKLS